MVDPDNLSNVKQLVDDHMTIGIRTLNTNLRTLSPEECFEAVINDRTHTILLVIEDELVINNRMLEFVAKLYTGSIKRVIGLKRMLEQGWNPTLAVGKGVWLSLVLLRLLQDEK